MIVGFDRRMSPSSLGQLSDPPGVASPYSLIAAFDHKIPCNDSKNSVTDHLTRLRPLQNTLLYAGLRMIQRKISEHLKARTALSSGQKAKRSDRVFHRPRKVSPRYCALSVY